MHAHSNCPDVIDHPFQPHVAHVHHEVESGCRMCGMHTEEVQLPTSAQVQVQVPLALPVAYAMHSTHAILGPGHGFDTKAADGMPDASRFASSPNIPCSAVLARPLNELPHEAHELWGAPWELTASPQLMTQLLAQAASVLNRSKDEMPYQSSASWELAATMQLGASPQLGAQPQPTELLPPAEQQLSPQTQKQARRQVCAQPVQRTEEDMDAVALLFWFRFADQ